MKFMQTKIRASLSQLNRLNVCYKALLIVMIGTLLYLVINSLLVEASAQKLRKCYASKRMYDDEDANVRWLDDILHSTRQPRSGRTIFFHQTTCLYGVVELTNRYYSFIPFETADADRIWHTFATSRSLTNSSSNINTLTMKNFCAMFNIF